MATAAAPRMTAAEYLAWEREQPAKHEFHLGQVLAPASGSLRHNLLSVAIASELRTALTTRGCQVLSSDQRIAAAPGERYVYADAVVVCEPVQTEPNTTDVLTNPAIVVEVLSPSTEAYDRGHKWEAYQRLPSLTDYLLVSQTQARIEHYHREPDGSWRYRVHGPGDTITLHADAHLSTNAIYDAAFELPAG